MQSESARLAQELEDEYRRCTPASAALAEQAQRALPGGDTRNSTYMRPYPLYIDRGEGAYLVDVDGNRVLDAVNNWTSLIHGHAHPAVVEAINAQAARGTAYAAANPHAHRLAEAIKDRVPSVDLLRFTNSGTEATMLALRAARAVTGRPLIVKMRGAYHGSHDTFEVADGVAAPGIIPGTADYVREVQFNNPEDLSRVMEREGSQVAAVIVEGVMGAAGMLPPEEGYLQHIRRETERHGALMVMDEVISLRVAPGGAQELFGVSPDLTTMGKIIGGGLPVGAVGGRAEVMRRYSPLEPGFLHHSGTFNANPLTMVAGIATLEELDADATGYINRLGERLAAGVRTLAAEQQVPLQVTGTGSLQNVHFAATQPRTAGEAAQADGELLRLLQLRLLLDGVFMARRGMFALSTVTTEAEVDGIIAALRSAIRWLRPAIAERLPVAAAG